MMKAEATAPRPMKNQRCQPAASDKNENAAPVLWGPHQVEPAGDWLAVAQLELGDDQDLGQLVQNHHQAGQGQPTDQG